MKVYIGGCVRNCETYLDAAFENIKKLIPLFDDYQIVIAFDKSEDMSLRKLCDIKSKYKMEILINPNPTTHIRTQNISNARNDILRYIRKTELPGFDHFIMIDMDDRCANLMDENVLKKYLGRDDWDALSFNRVGYYDIWALSIYPYIYSCWHAQDGYSAVDKIKSFIIDKLDKCGENDLLECLSAFNGFAIYRIAAFQNVWYEWNINKNKEIMPESWISDTGAALGQPIVDGFYDQDCEHRYFHIRAMQLNGARIRIFSG